MASELTTAFHRKTKPDANPQLNANRMRAHYIHFECLINHHKGGRMAWLWFLEYVRSIKTSTFLSILDFFAMKNPLFLKETDIYISRPLI